MKDKEVIKGSLLTLLLVPLTVFGCAMTCGLLAYFSVGGKASNHLDDVGSEVALVSMTVSSVASIGFTLAIIPLVLIPLNAIPRWVSIAFGVIMVGLIFYGNRLYHVPMRSWTGIVLMILLIPAPPGIAACFVFRYARARPPAGERLVQPLLWAFGSILVTTMLITFETMYLGGLPLYLRPAP